MMSQLPHNQPCPHCGHYDNRGISVDGVLINNDKILLIRRGHEPFKNMWALPGGHVDWDETVEQATIREVREETGLSVESLKLIGVFSKPGRHPDQLVAVAYLINVKDENFKAGDDAAEAQWWPLNSLPPELAFDHVEIIKEARLKNK